MRHNTCCVVNCKNTGKNSNCVFYSIPAAKCKIDQKLKWIAAIKRINTDGTPWTPKPSDYICSAHFVGNEKSSDPLNPSYIPTIFPSSYKAKRINEESKIKRHNRFLERRKNICLAKIQKNNEQSMTKTFADTFKNKIIDTPDDLNNSVDNINETLVHEDKGCQVDILFNSSEHQCTFTCNRFVGNSTHTDVEVQTEISINSHTVVIPSQKKFKDKSCETPRKMFVDKAVECNTNSVKESAINFTGFSSVKSDQELLDVGGVTLNNFHFLLKKLTTPAEHAKISKENRLFIFLMKIKTGLTFSAISVFFGVHRSTVSTVFFSVLQDLATATANLVFWPDKEAVQGTMPKCFFPHYNDTRVIIDCTEFKIQIPKAVDHRVYTYSHYKKSFTAKVLIGVTPGGFICLKSKVAGGRKSDSQLTIESGLLNLLEDGDIVLADKGFPEIRKTMDEKGKNVLIVMPPFLHGKTEFDKHETEATYSIARVRIHVERIMQRLRTYQILNKIPANLFNCIDNILHICCVLVNLQPPIISDT